MNEQHDFFDVLVEVGDKILRACVHAGNKEMAKEVWGKLKNTLEHYS